MPEMMGVNPAETSCSAQTSNRRTFLKLSGAAVALLGLAPGASGEYFALPIGGDDDKKKVDLGSGDTGILNYAYALEQLEAAFYTQVMQTPYTNMPDAEKQILSDIRDHEIVHREFFRAALGANAIPNLTPKFDKIKFNDRDSVLKTSKIFENLGVAAYNGAGKLLKSPDLLLIAGKIVSVEARHAAAISDLIDPRTDHFAPKPLDTSHGPGLVLKAAGLFIQDKISGDNLPKSKDVEKEEKDEVGA